jgi:RNA polymerase sigma factor (sigma-70 family)
MGSFTESEIIQGILKSDKDVLRWIYQNYYRPIKKFVNDNNGNDSDAEDVFQDSLMVIFTKIQNNELELSASFSTYLYSVARYKWFNELRRKRSKELKIDDSGDIGDNSTDFYECCLTVERENLFRKHFDTLASACKQLLQLVFKGFTITEITAEMRYASDQHTKNRRLKCKTILYNKIENDPKYKELKNEQYREGYQIPRW